MPVLAYPARIGQGDANGNLLSDGEYTYTYNHANRLTSVTDGTNVYSYTYNGDGTRTSTTSNGVRTDYVVDIAESLSQVLTDGEYTYLYGNGRISQVDADSTEYFLGDALGSVRQLVSEGGEVTLAESYEPYGDVLASRGEGESDFAYTGEEYDSGTGLVYLRARYYSASVGRFISQDTWIGSYTKPLSYNLWLYVYTNPINYLDPTGNTPYDRDAAVDYALKWANSYNTDVYMQMGDADCTNFVSQAMKAGGFPEDGTWYFKNKGIFHSECSSWPYDDCGDAWALTNDLYRYLISKGFDKTEISGTVLNGSGELVLPRGGSIVDVDDNTRPGDIVFYRQIHSDFLVNNPSELFNHAAFIVDWGITTYMGEHEWFYDNEIIPHIVDHSSAFSAYNPRAINDTTSDVNKIVIVHIPDDILIKSVQKGCEEED